MTKLQAIIIFAIVWLGGAGLSILIFTTNNTPVNYLVLVGVCTVGAIIPAIVALGERTSSHGGSP